MFPRLQKRGPIEACGHAPGEVLAALFPRLQKRGPIEAGTCPRRVESDCCFHAYKSVAPLKQRGEVTRALLVPGFHAYKSVAPLKQDGDGALKCAVVRFHAYKSVAPLKQQVGFVDDEDIHAVSTLTKAWPH